MTENLARTVDHGSSEDQMKLSEIHSYVTLRVAGQLFGVPVHLIRDILRKTLVTPVPLSSHVIAGSMNLRGRTVTVIDVRKRLNMPEDNTTEEYMNIVVEHNDELISLKVDEVGDVLSLPVGQYEKSPPNMAENWRDVSNGVYRLKDELLVVLDVDGILKI